MGRAMLSKSLIQLSVHGGGLFDLRLNYGRSNEDNGDLLQKVQCIHGTTALPTSENYEPCGIGPLKTMGQGGEF